MRSTCLILMLLLAFPAFAKTNFILAGDSWAQLMCTFQAFNKAFRKEKVKHVEIDCQDTSKLGAKARNWDGSKESNKLLATVGNASVVYLSLGGNDFLYSWNKNMGAEAEQTLIDETTQHIRGISEKILSVNPNVKILISGYDYGNFAKFTHIDSYERLFKQMGEPTPYELNTAFLRLSEGIVRAADFQRVFYIHHYGVVHYFKGNKDCGLRKKTTIHPDSISTFENPLSFGGSLDCATSKGSVMRIWPFYYDAFHLSPKGYFYLAQHATRIYLKDWLK